MRTFGFEIEAQTKEFIKYAINSGVYDRTAQTNIKTPSLKTRLKAELKYILQAPYGKSALQLLNELGALQCIHPTLKLDKSLVQQLRLLEACLRRFDPQNHLIPWEMRLEALIAHLEPQYRVKVATNLHLPEDGIQRLQNLATAQTQVMELLPTCQRPSQIVQLLRGYDLPMLILTALQTDRTLRRQIWGYLQVLVNVQPLLNGNDLKKLGYKPGPQYRQILDDLLAATVDGLIKDTAEAENFLAQHYPQ
jgi:tRNA nucleotidyltransferase (CCA-adding enzyme)